LSGQRQEDDRVALDLPEEEARPILEAGEIIGGQRIPWGSNYTFLVHIDAGPGRYLRAIYKPRDGEQPLHDFPDGSLYEREYGAYLLGRSLGWPAIPLTLIRDGPYGTGAVQHYVESDPNVTYFELIAGNAASLLPFAVFDVIANNADRKAGHCLLDKNGTIWSIDHGLTFHPVFKVRTVMLEFWGEPIPQPLVDDLVSLAGRIESRDGHTERLWEMFSEREMSALLERIEFLADAPVIPKLDPRRDVPWPLT
jgi:uncharacterized repeat protein (TIGR03843 family)